MALFIDVARGNPAVEERRTWLEPFWADGFVGYLVRGLLAERALWRGDTDLALAHAEAAIVRRTSGACTSPRWSARPRSRSPPGPTARSPPGWPGTPTPRRPSWPGRRNCIEIARQGASNPAHPKALLGPEGRGWLARAEAEYLRAAGHNTPEAWEAMLSAFGPHYVYETARGQWRLAEALIEAGRAEEARPIWRAAAATAAGLGAAPLAAALDALARRARLDPGPATGTAVSGVSAATGAYLTESLTERERDVLRLLARGQSNRQIGTELFISPKTASVHVSNILAKLAVTNRTEAAAIAHREGL